jgi:hypothetical protein
MNLSSLVDRFCTGLPTDSAVVSDDVGFLFLVVAFMVLGDLENLCLNALNQMLRL